MFEKKFFEGDQVEYVGIMNSHLLGQFGVVIDQTGPSNVKVRFAGAEYGVYPHSLKARASKFVTAWLDNGQYTFTGNSFATQKEADDFANAEVASNADTTMVVLKAVSKHSSSVKVESEAL